MPYDKDDAGKSGKPAHYRKSPPRDRDSRDSSERPKRPWTKSPPRDRDSRDSDRPKKTWSKGPPRDRDSRDSRDSDRPKRPWSKHPPRDGDRDRGRDGGRDSRDRDSDRPRKPWSKGPPRDRDSRDRDSDRPRKPWSKGPPRDRDSRDSRDRDFKDKGSRGKDSRGSRDSRDRGPRDGDSRHYPRNPDRRPEKRGDKKPFDKQAQQNTASDPTLRRRAIIDLLQGIFIDKRPMSEQMLDGKTTFARLSPQDRAQAQRQTTLILRHLDVLDAVLVEFLDRPPPLLARNVLRLCVAEMLLESLAPYAAIDGAVSFAKSHPRLGGFAALINAVGRNFARKVEAEALATGEANPESKEPTEEFNKEPKEPAEFPPQALPKDFRKHLIKTYDEDSVTAFEAAHHKGAATDITLKDQTRAEEYAEKLGATLLPNGSLRLPPRGQISALTGYDAGDWWVQDAAASIAVRACGELSGKRVLDMCAAPGGKALQLAAAGAEVTALDISKNRMSRVKENLKRCGLPAKTVVTDALEWAGGKFDVVVVDAPCSASGTMRRHPDLPFVKGPAPEPALVALQRDLLERAAGYLARGGVLVFAACSLYAEEGEAHADWIKAHPELGKTLSIVPLKAKDYGLPKEASDKLGGLRLRPDFWQELGGMDGFYILKLVVSG